MSVRYSEIDLRTRLYFLHLFGYWEPYFSEEDDSESDSDVDSRIGVEDAWGDDRFPKPLVYLLDEERDDPKYHRETKVVDGDDGFWTLTSMSQLEYLNTPVPEESFKECARRGYCPAHRHPLYVEYIEAIYSLLLNIVRKAEAAIDMSAAKSEMRMNPTTSIENDEIIMDSVYEGTIARRLRQLNGDFISIYTDDPETGQKRQYKIECKGCILTYGMGRAALDQVVLSQVAGIDELWDLILDNLQLDEIDELNWGESFQNKVFWDSFKCPRELPGGYAAQLKYIMSILLPQKKRRLCDGWNRSSTGS